MGNSSRAAARNQKFRQDVDALLIELGARAGADFGYSFTLTTPFGDLWIRAMDSEEEPWLACMFRDPDRAKSGVSGTLNPYSGKWNHMHSDLTLIRQNLIAVLNAVAQPTSIDSIHIKGEA